MNKIIYDQELIGVMDFLEKLSRARIKDCFKDEDTYYLVVEKGDIGRAIGKGAANIKRLRRAVRKNVRIVEFGTTAPEFVRNFIYPLKVEDIREEEGVILIEGGDKKTKSLLIGRDGRNLKLLNKAVRRFFNVEVKVV